MSFSSRFKSVAALLGAASQVSITGGEEAIEISAEDLRAKIEADTASIIAESQSASPEELTAAAAAERDRCLTALADPACQGHQAHARQLLRNTEMSAEQVIDAVKEVEAEAGGTDHVAAAAAAAARLNGAAPAAAGTAPAADSQANPNTGNGVNPPKGLDADAMSAQKQREAERAKQRNARLHGKGKAVNA